MNVFAVILSRADARLSFSRAKRALSEVEGERGTRHRRATAESKDPSPHQQHSGLHFAFCILHLFSPVILSEPARLLAGKSKDPYPHRESSFHAH